LPANNEESTKRSDSKASNKNQKGIFEVTVVKKESLGMEFTVQDMGVVITKILEGGAIHKSNAIQEGDVILGINNQVLIFLIIIFIKKNNLWKLTL